MRRLLSTLAIAASLSSSLAKAQVFDMEALSELSPGTIKIESVIQLPITGMSAVDTGAQILFLSENGRFAFSGQMYDLWYQTSVDTVAQLEDISTRIHLERMGFEPRSLNTVSFGTGSREITIFTDPQCIHCHALVEEAKAYADDFTFHLVVIPALGDRSHELAQHLACATDEGAALDALLNNTIPTLSVEDSCNTEHYERTLLASHVMGIKGVPFIIADDGRVSSGRPSDFPQWLEGDN